MAEIINLRKARKAAQKRRQEQQARENRIVHGRSKAERLVDEARTAKARRDLDAHHRRDPDGEP